MSKSTKIIAALGVVAGLGVAALPAFTYATDPVSTTGNVEVDVEVLPAIAMTITGNNDSGSHVATVEYVEVVNPAGNPAAQGWYEKSGDVYTASEDTAVDGSKTYYQTKYHAVDNFGPATATNSTIDIHTTPATAIAGTSSSLISLLPNSFVDGNDTNGFKSTVMVYTNAAGGYNLNVKDADSTLALTKIGSTETIPAGSPESPATTFDLVAGTAAWGYKVDTASNDGTGYTAISATDALIKQQSAPTSSEANRKTTVYYGVATKADQATGVYADTIVYTATTR